MPNIEITLRPSNHFTQWISWICLANLVIILTLPMNMGLKALAVVITMVYANYILKRYAQLTHPLSCGRIRCLTDGTWLLYDQNNYYPAILRGDSTLTQFVSVLRFTLKDQQAIRSCVVFKDATDPKLYRKLLVHTRSS